MKYIYHKIIPLLLLFFTVGVFGQGKSDYYYYKGEKVFLDINTSTISISFQNENSINSFRALENNSTKLSEIIEDHTKSTLTIIDEKANNRKNIKAYYLELSSDKNIAIEDYYQKIESYKNLPNTLTVSPTYITKEGTEFGLSNNFYVKLKNKDDVNLLYKMAKDMGVEVLGHNKYMPLWFTLSVTSAKKLNALNFANIFYESRLFESTEPAFMYHNLQTSNDPYFNDQWALNNIGQNGGTSGIDINAESAWTISTGNNITVAVIDQGIEMNHPDLQANISGNGFDAQTGTIPSQVRGAHGTACAGIIGAVQNNNIGISGVAPNSNLISVSVSFSGTTIQMLANGINWAWQNGADIISNSWGGGSPSSLFNDAINNALTNGRNGLGSIVVFSSGNDNVDGAQYPSNSNPLILCVGAIDRCGTRSGRIDIIPESCDPWGSISCSRPGSSYGTPLDIVAGGTSIATTDRQGDVSGNGDYNSSLSSCATPNNYSNYDYTRWFGGTSAACPYVSGVAALVLSVNPNLTVQEVNDIIEQSGQKISPNNLYTYNTETSRPNGTWNNELGYGLVDAHQAVLLAQTANTCNLNPPSILTTSNITHNSATVSWSAVANNDGYQLEYKQVLASSWSSPIDLGSNSITYTLNNLQDETIYQWRIRTKCYNGTYSDWSAIINFSTPQECIENETLFRDINFPFPITIEVSNTITSYSTLNVDANVTYSAGQRIFLKAQYNPFTQEVDGFHAKAGSKFLAKIEGCNNILSKDVIVETIYEDKIVQSNNFDTTDNYKYINNEELIKEDSELVKLYPNPAKNELNILVNNIKISSVELYTINGISVFALRKLYTFKHKINVNHLERGYYIVKVILEDGTTQFKNVILK